MRFVLACVTSAVLFLVGSGTASAFSTGEFIRATATQDWALGSFSGSVTWTDCNAGCDSYIVLIYNEPSVYTCHAEDWLENDPNIRQVWSSGGQTENKTISFEVNGFALLRGIYGQRLCMIGIQSTETEFGTFIGQQLVASKLFEVEAPPPPAPPPAVAPIEPPPTTKRKPAKRKCPKGKRKVKRHGKTRCVKRPRSKPRAKS